MHHKNISEIKDRKLIDIVKLSKLLSYGILPAVAKLKENKHDAGHIATDPQVHPNVQNHIFEILFLTTSWKLLYEIFVYVPSLWLIKTFFINISMFRPYKLKLST